MDAQPTKEQLADRLWRLQHLYHIADKQGRIVPFRPNAVQMTIFRGYHYRNNILKARQFGVTTAICILFLDTCLFNPNIQAGIIAHEREAAEEIFRSKIEVAFDRLPEALKRALSPNRQKVGEMIFRNGSRIKVATSFRSGTLQMLHISELGKICRKYPAKAAEIKTGAMEAVGQDGIIFIESTAEGQEGWHYEMTMEDIARSVKPIPLHKLERKFFFFPWFWHKDYRLSPVGVTVTPEDTKYFDHLEVTLGIKLDAEQRAWYVAKKSGRAGLGDAMLREYPSTPQEAFEAAVEGTYFHNEMLRARKDGRIGTFPAIDGLRVRTCWDIGNDTTAIWFYQEHGYDKRPRFINYYENLGVTMGLREYLKILREMQLQFGWHYGPIEGPHDFAVKDWGAEFARKKIAEKAGFEVDIAPRVEYDVGHEAIRAMLDVAEIDDTYCAKGVKALDLYRREWDDKLGRWRDVPLHDWASHGTSAFKTGALLRGRRMAKGSKGGGGHAAGRGTPSMAGFT